MKLSKFELDIVAQRVTDVLEAKHLEINGELLKSPEYNNFEDTYTDETVVELEDLLARREGLKAKIALLEQEELEIKEGVNKKYEYLKSSKWHSLGVDDIIVRYKKLKKLSILM
jgi:hypothetical protein